VLLHILGHQHKINVVVYKILCTTYLAFRTVLAGSSKTFHGVGGKARTEEEQEVYEKIDGSP